MLVRWAQRRMLPKGFMCQNRMATGMPCEKHIGLINRVQYRAHQRSPRPGDLQLSPLISGTTHARTCSEVSPDSNGSTKDTRTSEWYPLQSLIFLKVFRCSIYAHTWHRTGSETSLLSMLVAAGTSSGDRCAWYLGRALGRPPLTQEEPP